MKALARIAGLGLLAAGLAAQANAAPWSKSFLIETYEYAHQYGRADNARDQPGTDCPKGVNPDVNWEKALLIPGRTPKQVKELLDPERRSGPRFDRSFYYLRGPKGENVYTNPTVIKDTGQRDVESKVALGFDLDGNPETGGFVSLEGVKGIDNAFYRTSGCWMRFRGPERGVATYSNDGMHDGVFTIVMVLSGDKDQMNDDNAKLGIYLSKDKMVKDAAGAIARDYSFRIDPKEEFQTVADVKIVNGMVETKAPLTLRMRDFYTPGFFPKELVLEKARMRFEMRGDGSLFGIFGGYRDWMVHYIGTSGNGGWSAGAIHETVGHINLPIWWHALRRNADGMPDPKTGENRGISTVYRVWAIPAFVVTPDGRKPVTQARRFPPEQVAEGAGGAGPAGKSR
jgi:hypothetical protein